MASSPRASEASEASTSASDTAVGLKGCEKLVEHPSEASTSASDTAVGLKGCEKLVEHPTNALLPNFQMATGQRKRRNSLLELLKRAWHSASSCNSRCASSLRRTLEGLRLILEVHLPEHFFSYGNSPVWAQMLVEESKTRVRCLLEAFDATAHVLHMEQQHFEVWLKDQIAEAQWEELCHDWQDWAEVDMETASLSEMPEMLEMVTFHGVYESSVHAVGCRLVQKVIQENRACGEAIFTQVLEKLWRLMQCKNGNYVVQQCIQSLPVGTRVCKALIKDGPGQVEYLAEHCYGCRILIKLLQHSGDLSACAPHFVVQTLYKHCSRPRVLYHNQFAHYVIQTLFEHDHTRFPQRDSLVAEIANGATYLVRLLHGVSTVGAVAVNYGKPDEKDKVLSALLDSIADSSAGQRRLMKREGILDALILKQMQHYYSERNLEYDDFFHRMLSDSDGMLPVEAILGCNRMKALGSTTEQILRAALARSDFQFGIAANGKTTVGKKGMQLPTLLGTAKDRPKKSAKCRKLW